MGDSKAKVARGGINRLHRKKQKRRTRTEQQCVRFGSFWAETGGCHSCTQHPIPLKMAILYHRSPSLSTDSSHRLPAGNHSSACLFFRIAAAITSFTLSCLMAAGYFLTISASAALAARSSSLSSTNRAERSSQARILCHYFNLMALPTSSVFFIGGGYET